MYGWGNRSQTFAAVALRQDAHHMFDFSPHLNPLSPPPWRVHQVVRKESFKFCEEKHLVMNPQRSLDCSQGQTNHSDALQHQVHILSSLELCKWTKPLTRRGY